MAVSFSNLLRQLPAPDLQQVVLYVPHLEYGTPGVRVGSEVVDENIELVMPITKDVVCAVVVFIGTLDVLTTTGISPPIPVSAVQQPTIIAVVLHIGSVVRHRSNVVSSG